MARIAVIPDSPSASTEASPVHPDPSMPGYQSGFNGAGSSNRPLPTPPTSGRSPRDIQVTLEILSHDGIQIQVGESPAASRADQGGAGNSSRGFGPRPPTTRIDGSPGARQVSQDSASANGPSAPALHLHSSHASASAAGGGGSIPAQAALPASSMSGNPLPRPPNDPWRDIQARMHQPTPTRPIGPHGTWPHGILRGQGAARANQPNRQPASDGGSSGDAQAGSSSAPPSHDPQ
ncbi:hypothetical protein C8Q79DRAFT_305674 [Trametes meyenii]|nr:hypothetical protein C8Q79DRAFT_305674 [Trametes meyenii]